MDNLTYTYDAGNKLLKVADAGDANYGFKDNNNVGNDYTYDVNGNMTHDDNKEIDNIEYNHLNLPVTVRFNDDSSITYKYDASGVKLSKHVVNETTGDETFTIYAGNYIYENGDLQFFNHAEGYTKAVIASPGAAISSFENVYQYKDHLGNVRLCYSDSNNDGVISVQTEIIEESNYYPFGLKHKGYNSVVSSNGNSVAQRWKYGGKEFNDELGLNWYDISARNYDPALGRWMNIDPLAEQMRRHSPYNYAFNNPIFFIDPDGMAPCANGDCPEKESSEQRSRTTGSHTFKYDRNSKGVKKDVGTDFITETTVTTTSHAAEDGNNYYTTMTTRTTVSINSDGDIEKDNVKRSVQIHILGGGKSEYVNMSDNVDFSQVSFEQVREVETIAEQKLNSGRSPLQDKADNINAGVEIFASIVVGLATGGGSTVAQAAGRTIVGGAVGGTAAYTLIPDLSPERLKNTLYSKERILR